MTRPVIMVLAGVNGAGKSSVGGFALLQAGATWFNPDTFARELTRGGCPPERANSLAWDEGRRRLEEAIDSVENFSFETTLGGTTITQLLLRACKSHDVQMWYCGLSSPDQHIARVKARVASGGHDIPEDKIRERFNTSRLNLIRLMPELTHLVVFDNSREPGRDGVIPDPELILEMWHGRIRYPKPKDLKVLKHTPEWAKPILAAAMDLPARRRPRRR